MNQRFVPTFAGLLSRLPLSGFVRLDRENRSGEYFAGLVCAGRALLGPRKRPQGRRRQERTGENRRRKKRAWRRYRTFSAPILDVSPLISAWESFGQHGGDGTFESSKHKRGMDLSGGKGIWSGAGGIGMRECEVPNGRAARQSRRLNISILAKNYHDCQEPVLCHFAIGRGRQL